MNKKHLPRLTAVALGVLACGAAHATTYYINDCQSGAHTNCATFVGSGSNNGTTPSTPKQTYAQLVSAYTLVAGDIVLWAKGGAWTGVNIANNVTAAASFESGVITHDSYQRDASMGSARPILVAASGQRVFTQAGRGYAVKNLEMVAGASPATGYQVEIGASYAKLENVVMRGFTNAIGGSSNSGTFCSRLWVKGSDIRNNDFGYLGDCNDLLFEDNDMHANSDGTGNGDHNFYGSGVTGYFGGNKNLTIRNNRFYDQGGKNGTGSGKCITSSVVLHGLNGHFTFENNYFIEAGPVGNGCALLEANAADAEGNEGMIDCSIRGNKLIVLDALAGSGVLGINLSSAIGCTIENNSIQFYGNNNYNYSGIVVRAGGGADKTSSRLLIRNNSLRLARGMDGDSVGIRIRDTWTGARVVGNLCYQDSSAFFSDNMTIGSYAEWDYNLYYKASGSGEYANFAATLAAGQALGYDTHGVSANPQLVALPTAGNGYSMQIQTSSPAKNACGATSTLQSGCARLAIKGFPAFGTRDMGAWEFGSNPTTDVGNP